MSRYDGLIIPRSYNEYINKTDPVAMAQAMQLNGVLSNAVAAGDVKAVRSSAVNTALSNRPTTTEIEANYYNKQSVDQSFLKTDNLIPNNSDLNNYKTSGVYRAGWGNNCLNRPSGLIRDEQEFVLEVLRGNEYIVFQRLTERYTSNVWVRSYDFESPSWVWRPWHKLVTENEIAYISKTLTVSKTATEFGYYEIYPSQVGLDSFENCIVTVDVASWSYKAHIQAFENTVLGVRVWGLSGPTGGEVFLADNSTFDFRIKILKLN